MNLIILAFLVEQEQGLSDRYKSAIVEKDLSSFNSLLPPFCLSCLLLFLACSILIPPAAGRGSWQKRNAELLELGSIIDARSGDPESVRMHILVLYMIINLKLTYVRTGSGHFSISMQ